MCPQVVIFILCAHTVVAILTGRLAATKQVDVISSAVKVRPSVLNAYNTSGPTICVYTLLFSLCGLSGFAGWGGFGGVR